MKTKLPKYSTLGKLKAEADKLFFQVLIKERGAKCEFCGRNTTLGTFHIMHKSTHPRIRFLKTNAIIACWHPCHHNWHHNYFLAREMELRIKELVKKSGYVFSNRFLPSFFLTPNS